VHASHAPEKKKKEKPKSQLQIDLEHGKKLNYHDFKELAGSREGITDEQHLADMWNTFDADKGGSVDLGEYLEFSLHEALLHTHARVADIFHMWDEDKNGMISEVEFGHAIAMLGYDVPKAVSHSLFAKLDRTSKGSIGYKELKALLEGTTEGEHETKLKLMRGPEQADHDTRAVDGHLKAKDLNRNFVVQRVRPISLPTDLSTHLPTLSLAAAWPLAYSCAVSSQSMCPLSVHGPR